METWALEAKVRQDFIEPGKPVQNAFIESFNGRLREEKCTLPAGITFAELFAKPILEMLFAPLLMRLAE